MPHPFEAPAPAAEPATQDMAVIQIPHAILTTLAEVLPQFVEMVTAAAAKSGSDIASQKAEVEMPEGAPGTMAPDQNSPEVLAEELTKMRR